MAAKVKVLKNGIIVDEFEITKQSVLIGKGDHCDLVLNFPGVGREMARLTAEKDGFYLADVSVQGILVDGQRITHQRILPSNEIMCGSVQLQLVDDAASSGLSEGSSSATMLWEGFSTGKMGTVAPAKAYLFVKDQPGRAHEIAVEEFIIGRKVELVQLAVPDRSVSGKHARIARAGNKFLLADLNSTNGTFVNGKKVVDPIELNEGDEIKIGKAVFIFQRNLQGGETARPALPELIDIAKISQQATDVIPESPPPQPAVDASKKKRRLLLLACGLALVLMIMLIAVTSSKKPAINPAQLTAIDSLIQQGKLDDAAQRLSAIMKSFPADPRVTRLSEQLADARKQLADKSVADLLSQAQAKESGMDIVGAADLWAQVLSRTPENAEIQKRLCYAAYRIALVYEGMQPEADKANAIQYLELIRKLVKKENGADYDSAMKLLADLKK